MQIGPINWQTIHSQPLIAVPDCWKQCGGGFCCSNNHPDFQFRLMPKGGAGTVVIYLEDEYAWMRANGHVVCGEEHGAELPPMTFDFGGPAPLVLRHARCGYLGRCDGVVTKPLLCRSYPFIPVFDADGALEDVLTASIIDLTFQLKEKRRLCPLEDRQRLEATLAANPSLLEALRHPYIIFHTQAVLAFTTSYRERLQGWDKFARLSGPDFWQAWEMAYLGRQLVDREAVAAHLRRVHAELTARYGEFLRPFPDARGEAPQ
jgi:Fe-S-cluster containining protein